jgi:hypothetical protein
MTREYVVFARSAANSGTWTLIGAFTAASADRAVIYAARAKGVRGDFFAVPRSRWHVAAVSLGQRSASIAARVGVPV